MRERESGDGLFSFNTDPNTADDDAIPIDN